MILLVKGRPLGSEWVKWLQFRDLLFSGPSQTRTLPRVFETFQVFVALANNLPPSPRWQAKITQASAKLHAHREKVPYVIFSARENGWGLSFLRTLYSPYSVDRARMIATHQPATLNKYVWTLQDEKSYEWAAFDMHFYKCSCCLQLNTCYSECRRSSCLTFFLLLKDTKNKLYLH